MHLKKNTILDFLKYNMKCKKKLEDANQPLDLIKEELKRIKWYIEPAVEASKETLNKAKKSY